MGESNETVMASDVVIRAQGLGKRYALSTEGADRLETLREAVVRRGRGMLPAGLRGDAVERRRNLEEEFWALRELSFEVRRGERIGILGRNGAGKSTLLKILSRITEPTTGRVEIRGRVASLLEVGTGFHPDLSGRENIYLNGAILGIRRRQVKERFDEIVEFSEVGRFLDTPVKRYSSGMYVRLAFAVASSLESDILVVDEVLAVGDTRFQQKCLGRMDEISRDGRTVVMVSHNMAAVRGLCDTAIVLEGGKLAFQGPVDEAVARYLSVAHVAKGEHAWGEGRAVQGFRFLDVRVVDAGGRTTGQLTCQEPFRIEVHYELAEPLPAARVGFRLTNTQHITICASNALVDAAGDKARPGRYRSTCTFPAHLLNQGEYVLRFDAEVYPYHSPLLSTGDCVRFTVEDVVGHGPHHEKLPGVVRPDLVWGVSES